MNAQSAIVPGAGFAWPDRQKPMAFLNNVEQEVAAGHRSSSKANPAEAQEVAMLVTQLMEANQPLSSGEGIGIITPYTGQVLQQPVHCLLKAVFWPAQAVAWLSNLICGRPRYSMISGKQSKPALIEGQTMACLCHAALTYHVDACWGRLKSRQTDVSFLYTRRHQHVAALA